ncbi:unnamed protein product [Urochloa decumbens]|uniref:Receptor kinase-like protein Xa21 n=1 Tax=Urochloa decumbens TaxID=240449 RepID=A0ABC9B344_9POAL
MKTAATGRFVLVFLACSVHAITCSITPGNETDRLSLLEFKKAISLDPQQALASWNDSTHFCNWEGVMCRTKGLRRVTSLSLRNRGLVGHISPSLGNLTFLKHLFLDTNQFTGQIPASLVRSHRRLRGFVLSNNTLHGVIPSFANCSSLKGLCLNHNNLVGEFPDLPLGLKALELESNNLSGTIPSSLANITTLELLDFSLNNIEGNIPDEFSKFPVLQFLIASENQLAGRFPHAILNISALGSVFLTVNHLSGEVPPDLGSSLPNLHDLGIGNNLFHGHIPSSLANASHLNRVDMASNNFTGAVPTSFGKLHKLWWLNLEMNKLEGWEFIYSLGNCTKLQALSLYGNWLQGHVPAALGNLSVEMKALYLGSNQISGGFPSGIANLHNLNKLSLYANKIKGDAPEWLGALKSLQLIALSNNNFTGFIPSSLSNLSQLIFLYLDSNKFEGHLPASMGSLQNLQVCSISNNLLYGGVPKDMFGIPTIMTIDLSVNNLHGKLPHEVGNAKQLILLLLSSNKLFGGIPDNIGNCDMLENLELDHNSFGGSIPVTLGNTSGLTNLNLSHNNLTGSLPISLGKLQFLEQLDVSFNNLNGEVPTKGIFSNATALHIGGNLELCGGVLELHLPACSVKSLNSSMHKQSIAKVVVPLASIVSLALVISLVALWRGKHVRKYISLPSFGRSFPKVPYNDLARATGGFSTSNLIAKGRYSSVYQGKLFQDRLMIAVKVFSLETKGTQKSFITECNALRNARHRNLVPILTACSSIDSKGNDFKALVYEFMPRGDLHVLLHSTPSDGGTSAPSRITLVQRLCIVVDVANALEYLHHNNQAGTIVHCDLKPSNILLDESMTARVGDFGLARFSKVDSAAPSFTHLSTSSLAIKGTVGYVAPEYATSGDVSSAGDVYSFGIVLLEIILRKRPTDDMFRDGLDIARYVGLNFPNSILHVVDPDLLEDHHVSSSQQTSVAVKEKKMECLLAVLNVGLCCAKPSPNERMDMREVAARLHRIKESYLSGN